MPFFDLRWQDFFDILIVAYLIYNILRLFAGTRAMQLVRGVIIIAFVGLAAQFLELRSLSWLIAKLLEAFIILIPVIFHPELRRMLEEIGKGHFLKSNSESDIEDKAEQICKSLEYCRSKRIGALCVFQRLTSLKEIMRSGTILDAKITEPLLTTIFWKNSPLHDGAAIIDDEHIVAAGCYLPLSENTDISRWFGTRHRAAIGITEKTDAFAVVVSEERGEISVAAGGRISKALDKDQLLMLCRYYFTNEDREKNLTERLRSEINLQWSGDKQNDEKED
ncbi:MAG: TIGR00159 family protein [Synergistes sp.]|nr:TIGR00159 family protein [Synergistes sp.]